MSVWFMVLSFLFAMLVALTALHEARQRRADTALVFPPGAITPTVGRRSGGGYTTRQTPGHERLLTLRPAALDARAMDWPAAVASESH